MITTLVLQAGFAEYSRVTYLVAEHKEGFPTLQKALGSLGEVFLKVWREDYGPSLGSCCVVAFKRKKVPNYCSECGMDLREAAPRDPDYWEFSDYVERALDENVASFPFHDEAEIVGWSLWIEGNPFKDPSKVVVLPNRAGNWLAWGCELGKERPDDAPRKLDGKRVRMCG